MENTYYQEMLTAQAEAERLRKENVKLNENNLELRKSLGDAVNMIFELTAMDEEECPCGGDCGCKGDDDYEIET